MFGPRAPARLGARSGLLALLRVMVCVPSASSPSQRRTCQLRAAVERTGAYLPVLALGTAVPG